MDLKINNSQIKLLEISEIDLLWELFKRYYDEIFRSFHNERPLATEEEFKSYWCRPYKMAIVLYLNQRAIGFALLQKMVHPIYGDYLEVGAIYIEKENRKGLMGVSLYNVILDIGKQLRLPIGSEVAKDNYHSLKLARSLALRYVLRYKTGILKETRLQNGRILLFFDKFNNLTSVTNGK